MLQPFQIPNRVRTTSEAVRCHGLVFALFAFCFKSSFMVMIMFMIMMVVVATEHPHYNINELVENKMRRFRQQGHRLSAPKILTNMAVTPPKKHKVAYILAIPSS
jgi:hypothetical protein